jgi:phosphoribosyl 1,2-cyclic phosphodiesterase
MKMDAFVKFWGTRGSIPTPGHRTRRYGGNTPCVEFRIGEHLFICDAGSGIRELGVALVEAGRPVLVHLLFSHSHWDHIQGFPFFSPAYIAGNRLLIYGQTLGDRRFHQLLSGQMKFDYFPVDFAAMRAAIEPAYLDKGRKDFGGVRVETLDMHHPGGCIAYSFQIGRVKLVYATDNEIQVAGVTNGVPKDPATLRLAEPDLVKFVKGADLLIADAQYTDAQYATKVGWGHSSCLTAADLAFQAGVKQLAVFHHDPTSSDADIEEMLESCRRRLAGFGSRLTVFGAREGIELKF